MKIAYSGIEGSFASIAAEKIFPGEEMVTCKSFSEAYEKVKDGICDAAVLPIENSYAGEVGQVTDLMYEGDLKVSGVYPLRVSQNLLGIIGSSVSDIKKVISHPQALEQCMDYIDEHGMSIEQSTNTARAALEVSKLSDKSVGAIASKKTANLYGLSVLQPDINKDKMNTTRFAVFSKEELTQCSKNMHDACIMIFTVRHEAGALAKAIGIIGDHRFNMRVIRSRRIKGVQWQYYFYIELEGRMRSIEGSGIIDEMNRYCESVRLIGSYYAEEPVIEED